MEVAHFICSSMAAIKDICKYYQQVYPVARKPVFDHGVQRWMISVDNFFVFLRLLVFAVLLLYVTLCTMWKLYFTFLMCLQHLEIFYEI